MRARRRIAGWLRPLPALAVAVALSGCLGTGDGLPLFGAADRGAAADAIEITTLDDAPLAAAGGPADGAATGPGATTAEATADPGWPAAAAGAEDLPAPVAPEPGMAPDDPPPDDPLPAAAPPSPEAAACLARGGRAVLFGGGPAVVCAMPARDAGQRCDSGRDCQGLCLARSRTCAPFVPLLGCHDVLTDNGMPARQCIE